jgi:hypothetical protein
MGGRIIKAAGMYNSVHFLYLGMLSLMAIFCYSCYNKSVKNLNLKLFLEQKIRETIVLQKLADATVKSHVLEQEIKRLNPPSVMPPSVQNLLHYIKWTRSLFIKKRRG